MRMSFLFQKILGISIWIILGSSLVTQVAEAQRPFITFFNGIQDFFANLRPIRIPSAPITPAPWPITEQISDIEDFNSVVGPPAESVFNPSQGIQGAQPPKPLQNVFGNIQQFFATRRPFGNKPATTTPVPQWPTEVFPALEDFNNVEPVKPSVWDELLTITAPMETNTACSTVTQFLTPPDLNTAEMDPITVTVTKWSNLDTEPTSVVSTFSTTVTAESLSDGHGAVISTHIETSIITQTSTATFTETLPAIMKTETVTQTSIEVQRITETLSPFTFTETLPAITTTSIITQTVAVNTDAVTQTSIERITETLPAVIVTKTSEVRVTETPNVILSTISVTVTADASTLIQTSIDVQRITETLPAMTFTETLPAITSFSTIIETTTVDHKMETVTVTDTKVEQQTVSVTDQCKESASSTNVSGDDSSCAICLSQDEYDYLFSDYDDYSDGKNKGNNVRKTNAVKKPMSKRQPEIESAIKEN